MSQLLLLLQMPNLAVKLDENDDKEENVASTKKMQKSGVGPGTKWEEGYNFQQTAN